MRNSRKKMITVEMPKNASKHRMVLRISETGEISMNRAMMKCLEGNNPFMEFDFLRTDDFNCIELVSAPQKGLFKFRKDGKIRHEEFMQQMKLVGYQLPVKYNMEWDKRKKVFWGQLE